MDIGTFYVGDSKINLYEINSTDEFVSRYTLEDLENIIHELEDIEVEELNQFDIIERYSDGKQTVFAQPDIPFYEWRYNIPKELKEIIPQPYSEVTLEQAIDITREAIQKGLKKGPVFDFYNDLIELNHPKEEPEETVNQDFLDLDSVAEGILKTVEMIILPHLEVLDKYHKMNGRIKFANVWNEHFSDKLKEEVKQRDSGKCVVCGAFTNLHVHHKIPRNLGGMNHRDNLVTLCGSCHPAIETADVQRAFKTCLLNFKKQKFESETKNFVGKSKEDLKREVLDSLDSLISRLSDKANESLAIELYEIQKKTESIFYD